MTALFAANGGFQATYDLADGWETTATTATSDLEDAEADLVIKEDAVTSTLADLNAFTAAGGVADGSVEKAAYETAVADRATASTAVSTAQSAVDALAHSQNDVDIVRANYALENALKVTGPDTWRSNFEAGLNNACWDSVNA